MADITIPGPGELVALEDRRPNPTWWRVWQQLVASYNQTVRDLGDANSGIATKATKTQTVAASFVFKFPENETVRVIVKCPFAWSITEVTTRTEVGTATVTVSIDGVALGGTANSASTAEESQAHTSANAVAESSDVELTFASTSSDCENLCITLAGTRELA